MREAREQAVATVVEEELDAFLANDRVPGVVVGVVADGVLAAAVGRGVTRLPGAEDPTPGSAPDRDTVFRIASMTKSFTAATVLSLRDEGVLQLDDPVVRWLPSLADPAPYGITVTLRHLLTMAAGLPTDDPWGDRQQDLPLSELDALAASGFSWLAPPGTAFEYANLGYALLGRVVTAATGVEFGEAVAQRILRPLGLASTAFDAALLLDPSRLALGYVPRGEGPDAPMEVEPFAPHGAFSPMGGLFSSVSDLAVWVTGFLASEADASVADAHPLSAASRREMTRMQRFGALILTEKPGAAPTARAVGYGLGLMEEAVTDVGRVVHHSGGYPGFGSHMRWHPASGIAVIGLGNRTYAPMHTLTATIMARLVSEKEASRGALVAAPTLAGATGAASPSIRGRADEAVEALTGLLHAWDDAAADHWFGDNMDRDVPRELRRAQVAEACDSVGPLDAATAPAVEPGRGVGGAHRTWWVQGARGSVRSELLMGPQLPSLVQWWSVTAVVDPSPGLVKAAQTVLARANSASGWPEEVRHEESFDERAFVRAARWLSVRCGAVSLGTPVRGDGTRTATWRLASATSDHVAELTLELGETAPLTVSVARISVPPVTVP